MSTNKTTFVLEMLEFIIYLDMTIKKTKYVKTRSLALNLPLNLPILIPTELISSVCRLSVRHLSVLSPSSVCPSSVCPLSVVCLSVICLSSLCRLSVRNLTMFFLYIVPSIDNRKAWQSAQEYTISPIMDNIYIIQKTFYVHQRV